MKYLDDRNLETFKYMTSRKKQKNGIGATRTKLAKIVSECLGVDCQPEDLQPAVGAWRTDRRLDVYCWEVTTRWPDSERPFWAGCWETMTECVKAGKVHLSNGEIFPGAKQ